MPALCAVCANFNLSAEIFVSRTTASHHKPGTGCIESHNHGGTDCNGQCDWSTQQTLTTRPFIDVKRQQNCNLCRLVTLAVEEQFPRESRAPGAMCELRTKRHRGPDVYKKENYKVMQVLIITGKAKRDIEIPKLDLLPVISEEDQYKNFFIGKRIEPNQINVSEVNGWLQECLRGHGGPCQYKDNSGLDEIRQHIRVIDVRAACVVSLPRDAEYTALSYVWGTSKKEFKALRRNITAISKSGSLDAQFGNIPLVIQDAISFTKSLGLQYLWVDRLCIVQDDEKEKAKTIPKMNVIYQSAFLTLFSCGWGDTSGGLTGVRPARLHREQKLTRVAPDLELMMPHNLEGMLISPWANRGWTFQEFFSSRRKLLFINGQVTMICRNGSFREDLSRSHVTLENRFMRLGPQEWQPPLQDRSLVELRELNMNYVEEFIKRNLSFDRDVLDAFSGVTSFLSAEVGLASTFGLPNHTFGLDLLWNPQMYLRRRKAFPSWSWAGWVGNIRKSKSGTPRHREKSGIRTQFSRQCAWLAGLFFLAFYVYRKDDAKFLLVSDIACQGDHQIAVPSGDYDIDFPLVDLSRDIAFDPRNEDLQNMRSKLLRVTLSAPRAITSNIDSSEFSNSTLHFRTVVIPVLISTRGPDDLESKQPKPEDANDSMVDTAYPSSHFVYLFALDGTFLGLAWLNEKEMHERLHQYSSKTAAGSTNERSSIDVAVVSGPIPGNWRTRSSSADIDMGVIVRDAAAFVEQFSTDHQEKESDFKPENVYARHADVTHNRLIKPPDLSLWPDHDGPSDGWGTKVCPVLLLGSRNHQFRGWQTEAGCVKERLGLGEIKEDVLCGLKDSGIAKWEDVYLD